MRISPVMKDQETLNFGPQPIGALMERLGIGSHDLVSVSPEQLTHKQVQKARSGRRLTLKLMLKVTRALNACVRGRLAPEERGLFREYLHRDLFTYAKGHDPAAARVCLDEASPLPPAPEEKRG